MRASTAATIRCRPGRAVGLRARVGADREVGRIDGSPVRVPGLVATRPTDRVMWTMPMHHHLRRSKQVARVRGPSPSARHGRRTGPLANAVSHGATLVPPRTVATPPTMSVPKRAKRLDWSSRRRTKSSDPRLVTRARPHPCRHRTKRRQGPVNGTFRPVRGARMALTARHHQARRSADAGAGGIGRARARAAEGHRPPEVETLRTRVGRTTDRAHRIGS